MLNALNQGAGSEASLPVTLRSRRSAPSCTFDHSHIVAPDGRDRPVWETICFPDAGLFCCKRFRLCGGESGALRSPPTLLRTALPCFLIFLVAGGIAPAGATRGLSDRPLDPFGSHYRSWFLSLQGELHILNIAAKTIIEIARGFPPHFSISITLRLNTARPWFFLSVRKRLSVFSSTAMSIGLERCMSMPASKLC